MNSYLTLARYHDDCSRPYQRARNLDDIRTRNRELIHKARLQLKCIQMLQNRRSLASFAGVNEEPHGGYESDTYDDNDEDYKETHFEASEMNFSASQQRPNSLPLWAVNTPGTCNSSEEDFSWFPGSSTSPSSCSSPCSDGELLTPTTPVNGYQQLHPPPTSSSSHYTGIGNATQHCERTSIINRSSVTSSKRSLKSPLVSRAFYKQTGSGSSSSRSSPSPRSSTSSSTSSSSSYLLSDPVKFKSDFNTLKEKLNMCGNNPHLIGNVIMEHWQLMLNSMQFIDTELLTQSCLILTTLAGQNLLLPQVVLHIFQNGLIYKLYATLQGLDDRAGFKCSLELLTSLARSTPSIIPYMMDLISSSKLREAFEERLEFGSFAEVQLILEFNCLITETLLSQLYSNTLPQPLIPDTLLLTGVTKETVESYSPITTMLRCITPNLLKRTVVKCLSRACASRLELINVALILLANSLKLIHIMASNEGYTQSIVELLTALKSSSIESNLHSLVQGIERRKLAAESSEHCSQGIDVNSSSQRALSMCQQFSTFYQQYFDNLLSNYIHLIDESAFEEPIKAQGWTL